MNGLYLQLIIIYYRVSLGCLQSLRIWLAEWNGEELCCDAIGDWPAGNYTFIVRGSILCNQSAILLKIECLSKPLQPGNSTFSSEQHLFDKQKPRANVGYNDFSSFALDLWPLRTAVVWNSFVFICLFFYASVKGKLNLQLKPIIFI